MNPSSDLAHGCCKEAVFLIEWTNTNTNTQQRERKTRSLSSSTMKTTRRGRNCAQTRSSAALKEKRVALGPAEPHRWLQRLSRVWALVGKLTEAQAFEKKTKRPSSVPTGTGWGPGECLTSCQAHKTLLRSLLMSWLMSNFMAGTPSPIGSIQLKISVHVLGDQIKHEAQEL